MKYRRHATCKYFILSNIQPLPEDFFNGTEEFNTIASLGSFNEWGAAAHKEGRVFRLYSLILRRYFKLNESIVREVDSLLAGYPSRYLVGFHLRISGKESDFAERNQFLYQTEIPRFLACSFIDYAQNPVFFVASDSSKAKRVIAASTNRTVLYQTARIVHTRTGIRNGTAHNGVNGVLTDVLALSRCRFIVGTKGSSLTYLAAAFQGHYPFYITRDTDCYYPSELSTRVPK